MLSIRNEFQKIPSVEKASLSYEMPNGNNGFQVVVHRNGANPEQSFSTQGIVTDEAFIDTYGISLIEGAFFGAADNNQNLVVINEKALEAYGFKTAKEAIGKQLKIVNDNELVTVKGVIKDFHFETFHEAIKPQLFFNVKFNHHYRYLSFKLKPGNIETSIAAIDKKWKELLPNASFEYTFMDDTLANLYQTELQFQKATYTASLLSLIIALLGIFGMVSLSINKKIKEIGIRKVLGASVKNISFLFIKDFLSSVVVAVLIAFPIAYFLMSKWLANYTYKIEIGMHPFLLGSLLIGAVTILVVLFQTLKAATTNPVNSLRSE